jgi:NAD(P)-dependent dehydrogenase (short-subunit alcohol dehydrogenase family)
MASLVGRHVLITGASSGIGAAAARAFAQAGADVSLLARSSDGLERVADEVRAQGSRAFVATADVTDQEAVHAAVARAEAELGGLDVLVSNAGATVFGDFAEVTKDDFDRTVEVTFTGAVNVIRAALPALERRRGTIIAVGSIMTKVPLPTFSSYAAAKHALLGFVNSLRVELVAAGSAVTISMVHPAAVDTPLWDHTSTAGDRLPRRPPDLYKPEVIADALVACAVRPRHDVHVGSEATIVVAGWTLARPVAERVLALVHRLYTSGRERADGRGALWEAVGTGEARGTGRGRPSLTLPLRLALPPLRLPGR